ncbi:sodium:proton antiporter [Lactiplantibacillus sp. WILCCON 0030]|uniref:Sodium:proton antiporter n=1 Tax=Lactiplantibacillus brownii TaxID=3069269 RepID=A0ABU1AAL7_9LACO|nr:sodium:proton antiporter [Lactiplantibacillus brownii]MDQ7937961.1 sodium:proton antiporter [Lactiplantibacillus brownii]
MATNIYLSTFVILMAVAVSNILAQGFKRLSPTYINLLMGLVVGVLPLTNAAVLSFNNEIFMAAIIAPLLFFEGQNTRVLIVRRKRHLILGTAVGLAVAIAIIVGSAVHLIGGIAWPLALIMVAISAPTDATALDSVTGGRQLPTHVGTVLRMEALFNDATGLIILQAGVLWYTSGHLALGQNLLSFLWSAGGGLVFGAGVAFLLMVIRQSLLRSRWNFPSSQIIIYLMTPVVIYLLAEVWSMSGIIAVVSAGLVYNGEAQRSRFSDPRQFHLSVQLINFGSEILNSFVFVILGILLARIMTGYQSTTVTGHWFWLGILVYGLALIVRYGYARLIRLKPTAALIFALGGVHGTVTLALALSVAVLTAGDNQLVLLVETVVIILSMIVPTILLPRLLPADLMAERMPPKITKMRQAMVAAGLARLTQLTLTAAVKASVTYDLRDQLRENRLTSFLRQWGRRSWEPVNFTGDEALQERRALMQAFDAERQYLYDLVLEHRFDSKYIYSLYSEILLAESLVLDPDNQSE